MGDGITGVIRDLKSKRRTKAWEGTAGMLVLCIIIGAKMGFVGIFAGIICSFVKRVENIDDNITVPVSGLFILLAAHYYLRPPFTTFSRRNSGPVFFHRFLNLLLFYSLLNLHFFLNSHFLKRA
jgi:hypothetical protein